MVLAGPSVVPFLRYSLPTYAPQLSVWGSSQNSQGCHRKGQFEAASRSSNLMYVLDRRVRCQPRHCCKYGLQDCYSVEYQRKSAPSSPKPATSYRKKKVERISDDMRSYEDPSTKLYHTSDGFEFESPVLLIDGYNLCGYWPKLKKHFSKGHLDAARQKLVHELINFSAMRGVKVVVVFDAMLSGMTTHKETTQNIDVVYTGESCADSWIEKEVSSLRADGCPRVWVVTSDSLHQHAAYGAGAYIWNCRVLISEIKEAKKELLEAMHDENIYSVKGKLLEHNLDQEVRDALENLKQQLKADHG